MKRRPAFLCSVFVAVSLAAGAAAASASFDANAAKSLFETHCSRCHPLDRPLRKTKDRASWQKTVDRMKGYAGGTLGDPEAQMIVEYLSRVRGPANP